MIKFFQVGACCFATAGMPPTNFDQAAYITCKEAHAMQPEARKTLAIFLAELFISRRDDP